MYKFLTKLTEALEAPELPDEDKWGGKNMPVRFVTGWISDNLRAIKQRIDQISVPLSRHKFITISGFAKRRLETADKQLKQFVNDLEGLSWDIFSAIPTNPPSPDDMRRYESLKNTFHKLVQEYNSIEGVEKLELPN